MIFIIAGQELAIMNLSIWLEKLAIFKEVYTQFLIFINALMTKVYQPCSLIYSTVQFYSG